MRDIFFADQNGRIVFDRQGNSSFEVHNHSKGRDYTGVQLNIGQIESGPRWMVGLKWTLKVNSRAKVDGLSESTRSLFKLDSNFNQSGRSWWTIQFLPFRESSFIPLDRPVYAFLNVQDFKTVHFLTPTTLSILDRPVRYMTVQLNPNEPPILSRDGPLDPSDWL